MRDSSLLETEAWHFEDASIVSSEGFDRVRLFGSILRPIGIVPTGTCKVQSDRGKHKNTMQELKEKESKKMHLFA
jgi:hypothetical protein